MKKLSLLSVLLLGCFSSPSYAKERYQQYTCAEIGQAIVMLSGKYWETGDPRYKQMKEQAYKDAARKGCR